MFRAALDNPEDRLQATGDVGQRAAGRAVVLSEAFHSGSGRYLQHLVNELARRHEIVVVSPAHENETGFSAVSRRVILSVQGWCWTAAKALAMQVQTVARIWHALRLRQWASCYLVLFPGHIVFALQLMLFLRLLGKRIIFNVHDVRPHARHLPFLPRWMEHGLFGLLYRLADHIVVLTQAAAQEIQAVHSIEARRISVIPHGTFDVARAVLPCPGGADVFLVFGTLRENKCIAESIQAVQSLRRDGVKIELAIAGAPYRGELAYWSRCRQLIATAPEGIDVREGYVADADLPRLFGACSALILPYKDFTSQSGVAVMSILSGRPVLATGGGGLDEILADGGAGVPIATPVSAQTIAAAILRFRAEPIERRYAAVIASAGKLRRELSWERVAADYSQVLGDSR